MLSHKDKNRILKLARDAITSYLSSENPDLSGTDSFNEKQGVFVSIHKKGILRGCIGFPEPVYPLRQAVVIAARAAAFEDPRFPPLDESELTDIKIEISILSVPELIRVKDPEEYKKEIAIGLDGLIIRNQFGHGLLLPQVAPEWGWGIEQYLTEICIKAGLDKDSWKDSASELYKFQAEVFSEEHEPSNAAEDNSPDDSWDD
ncbi:TIGR00296 family protein [Candidatus Woesearchaeota archaeon]|nr:TIGR00296 family protein [Candidatus Woesearchaeota archaeon]